MGMIGKTIMVHIATHNHVFVLNFRLKRRGDSHNESSYTWAVVLCTKNQFGSLREHRKESQQKDEKY